MFGPSRGHYQGISVQQLNQKKVKRKKKKKKKKSCRLTVTDHLKLMCVYKCKICKING